MSSMNETADSRPHPRTQFSGPGQNSGMCIIQKPPIMLDYHVGRLRILWDLPCPLSFGTCRASGLTSFGVSVLALPRSGCRTSGIPRRKLSMWNKIRIGKDTHEVITAGWSCCWNWCATSYSLAQRSQINHSDMVTSWRRAVFQVDSTAFLETACLMYPSGPHW